MFSPVSVGWFVSWLVGWQDYTSTTSLSTFTVTFYIQHSMHVIVPVLKSFATFGPVFYDFGLSVSPSSSMLQLNA